MRMIWCTFSVIGFHKYKSSPKDVKYLRQEHRHKFNFKVSVEVTHENREIEFHMLRRDCIIILKTEFSRDIDTDEFDFEGCSCELIADQIMQRLLRSDLYNKDIKDNFSEFVEQHGRQIFIAVDEDGENGGSVTRY